MASGCTFLSTLITNIQYILIFAHHYLNTRNSLLKLLLQLVHFEVLVGLCISCYCSSNITLSKNGVAATTVKYPNEDQVTSDHPRPSSTITANITEAKLKSSFTYNNKMPENINIPKNSHTIAQNNKV